MAEEKNTDSGLGLGDFLAGKPEAPEGAAPSQEAAAPVVEAKPEPKTETVTPPVKEVVKEAAPAKEEKKEESKPQFDWEAEDNPYKKRHSDTYQWANRVNQENAELKRQLQKELGVINKKLDGTYDPATDIEPPVPVEHMTALAEVRGKAVASKQYAIEMAKRDGKDQAWVENQIAEFDRTLGNNPVIQARILASPSPIVEALEILKEQSFTKTWGRNVAEIETKIRDDERKKIDAKMEETVTKRLEDRLKNVGKQPTGIREARESATDNSGSGWQPKSLDDILSH